MSEKELEIGNKVKVIGPSINGITKDIGHIFTIHQTFTNYEGVKIYTNGQEYCYPAGSLQLIPNLKENDWVEIIGPDILGLNRQDNKSYQIKLTSDLFSNVWTVPNVGVFPASSLRLVEDLKVDDWVEVIRPNAEHTGKIGKIIRIDVNDDFAPIQTEDRMWWRPTSLRKLTSNEIEEHLKSEMKVDDWVEVIGPNSLAKTENIGAIFCITDRNEHSGNLGSIKWIMVSSKKLAKAHPRRNRQASRQKQPMPD
jgi:hypothetical protein